MGRELKLEDPNQRQNAGEQVRCISGNCCDPATWSGAWDMVCIRCIFCPDDAAVLDHLRENGEVWLYDSINYPDPYFDGTVWKTRNFPGGGFAYMGDNGKHVVGLLRPVDCASAADTLYHEVWHTKQPPGMTTSKAEFDAYYNTEIWTIRKGLSGRPNLRSTDEFGNVRPDRVKVQDFVNALYPGTTNSAGWRVTKHKDKPPMTQEYNDATGVYRWRPSKLGDSHAADGEYVGETYMDPNEFYCN